VTGMQVRCSQAAAAHRPQLRRLRGGFVALRSEFSKLRAAIARARVRRAVRAGDRARKLLKNIGIALFVQSLREVLPPGGWA
jgi:hypothetical protein